MDARAQTELDLISAIYDAAIDPSRWNDAIDRIRRALGFQLGMFTILTVPDGQVVVAAQSNVPHPFSEIAPSVGSDIFEQWGGLERIQSIITEEPVLFSDYNDLADLAGNQFYENWGRPLGLVDELVIVLEYNTRFLANIAFGVQESSLPITETQVEALRVLAPHLRRAAIISGLLDRQAQVADSFEAALSALGSAVVLVDAQMHIVYANEKAEEMLHAGEPLVRLDGRLDLPRELVRGQLEAAVRAAERDARGLQRGGGVPVRCRDGTGLVVHVLPLKRRKRLLGGVSGDPVAALFVGEPNSEVNLPIAAIQQLYGLRPAESRVFELIVSGMSAPKIAQALGVAVSTVKTHTLRLFEKLGVHSRAQLLRLARNMSLGPR
jgi:DNA-binding CsgD family transcriptional regulator/PAS domain-containing protein